MRYNRDFLPRFTNKHSDSIIEQAESIAITIRYNHFVFPFRPFFFFFFFLDLISFERIENPINLFANELTEKFSIQTRI